MSFTIQEQLKYHHGRMDDQLVNMYNQNSERFANQVNHLSEYIHGLFLTQQGNMDATFQNVEHDNAKSWGTYWTAERAKGNIEEDRHKSLKHELYWLRQEMKQNKKDYEKKIENLSKQLEDYKNLHSSQHQNQHERMDVSLNRINSKASKKMDKVYKKQKKMWGRIKATLKIVDSSSSSSLEHSKDQAEDKDSHAYDSS